MLLISQHQYFLFQTQNMLTGAFSAWLTISGLGHFHLDHSCKSESAFLQEEELTRLHYTAPEKTHTHPTAWASFPMGKVKVH